MRRSAVLAVGLLVLLLGAAPSGAARTASPEATPGTSAGDIGGLVDVGGGRRLWLECRGRGSPTVVLEAGYPDRADVWDVAALDPASGKAAVLPGVAAFTRVCAYDRPGTVLADPADPVQRSRSDPVPQPRTAADLVADLHALLREAGEPAPYVLVGHSLGGLVVRLYAATYPDEVAGLVLVDSSHEEQGRRLRAQLTPEQWAAIVEATIRPPGLGAYPDLERIDLEASSAQMREAAADRPLPPLPLVVLSHGRPYGAAELPPGVPPEALERAWQELQAELAALVPGARHVVAAASGHYIHVEQPELVVEAVRQVVAAARDPGSWTTPVASPGAGTPRA